MIEPWKSSALLQSVFPGKRGEHHTDITRCITSRMDHLDYFPQQ